MKHDIFDVKPGAEDKNKAYSDALLHDMFEFVGVDDVSTNIEKRYFVYMVRHIMVCNKIMLCQCIY